MVSLAWDFKSWVSFNSEPFATPLVYGGHETHIKHDWDTQEDVYYIKEKSLQYSQIGKNKKQGWGESKLRRYGFVSHCW